MPRARPITVAYRLIEVLARASVGLAEDFLPLVERAGITPEERSSEQARVPVDKMDRFWERLVEHTGDPCVGFQLATRLDLEAYGAFGTAVRAGTSIEETVAHANRFGRLLHDAAAWQLRRTGDTAQLAYVYEGTDRRPHHQAAAFALGGTVQLFRRVILARWTPIEISFEAPPPRDIARYEALAGTTVRFGANENAMSFDASVLDQRLISGNPGLSALYRERGDQLLAERASSQTPSDTLLGPIRAAIVETLPRGEPTLERLARRLAVSPRTLQRRLKSVGTTFNAILDDTRRELTLSLLSDEKLPLSQIGFLVGYSDPSAFRRAFKRWTHQSPQEYQRHLLR